MSLADELWGKYRGVLSFNGGTASRIPAMFEDAFHAALKEYGEAVRKRDVEVCMEYDPKGLGGIAATVKCAAAIKDEPLP